MSSTTYEYKDELIYESIKTRVYKRVLPDDTLQIVKVLNIEFPTIYEVKNFYNEYNILKHLPIIGVRKVISKGRYEGYHSLVFEYCEGSTLSEVFKNKQKDIEDFLHIAIAICKRLGEVHQLNVIHKDLNPNNILVDLHAKDITLIDFSFATRIDATQSFVGNPAMLNGHLSYISPEQTGRMNRIVDHRSDLYSVGVCFYEMLTGILPFTGEDALATIHTHIAYKPTEPHNVNPIVPQQISNMVMKLLNKNAEDRYQSAFGIMYDLEHCLSLFLKDKNIPLFKEGVNDISGKFLAPQKLYGRSEEIKELLESFKRCSSGEKELILVTGYSGTGKTALVNEVHKPLTARKAYFINGKYDQFQRSVPYYAILQAFNEFLQIILTENEEKLQRISELIQNAVKDEGKVLTNVLPDLKLLIGEQKEIPEVGGNEAHARFNYIFTKFIDAICTFDHPLVIFIDDLQWADSASLELLEAMMTQNNGGYLMFIGAYRDNEVTDAHPLIKTIDDIKRSEVKVQNIHIGNLKKEHVHELICDATESETDDTRELTDLIYSKTSGNAFFTTKFLKTFADEGDLYYDFKTRKWKWDLKELLKQNISENVVEFLSTRIKLMDMDTIDVLKTSSCIGNIFDIRTLAVINDQTEEQTRETLFNALREGLLFEINETKLKFAHDRIQQAVDSLLFDEDRDALHYRIGETLLAHDPEDIKEKEIFEIVNHLNIGRKLIHQKHKKTELSELNLKAGKKAKINSAFKTSSEYFTTGIELLPADGWENHYKLCLDLHSEACESHYLNGEFEKMEYYFEQVNKHAKNNTEKLKCYESRILAFKAQNKLNEAIDTGLSILSQLGEKLPSQPNTLHVFGGLIALMIKLRSKSMEDLLELPEMTDPVKISAMRIIADITSSVYWARPNLLPLIVFKMMNISMKYGNNAVSCFAYGSFGVILCGVLGQMKKGNEFAKLSLKLLEKLDAKEWKAQIYVAPYALTLHWRNHVDVTLKPLRDSYHIGLETGLIEFACVNTNIYCIHSFLSGKELKRLEKETKSYSDSYQQMNQSTNFNYNEVYRQAMLNFMNKSEDPLKLSGEAFNEDSMLAQNQERDDKTGTFFIHFLKLMLNYYFGKFEEALDQAGKARKLLDAVLAKFEIPNHHFYESLAALSMAELRPGSRRKYLKISSKGQKALKKWAKDSPDNFLHKYYLIEAERLRIKGKPEKAAIMYQFSIERSSKNGFTHEEALAYELAGRFYSSLNIKGLADYYLKSAYNTYREWGAEAKLNTLSGEFTSILSSIRGQISMSTMTPEKLNYLSREDLDLMTFIKSANTVSSEVVLPQLLSILLKLVNENAGAQKGVLMLFDNEELFVEAFSDQVSNQTSVMQHISPFGIDILAESVLKYCIRTRENVVINDALNDRQFMNDEYVQKLQIHSVMCLPIINQGKFTGIIYLENADSIGAFTGDRVLLLTLLSSQIAISIENALLYNQLENKVIIRTQELSNEKLKSDELLYNILPYETAQDIKMHGSSEPMFYKSVSVLFTDFKDFTTKATSLSPKELVEELNECFIAFDEIIERNGIEKIKTIGDAYMAAGGVPVPSTAHAVRTVKAAIEIRDFIIDRRKKKEGLGFEMRIGIHSGPVISGIVGKKKFQYDIWGDTVNIAARMEQNSEPDKINLSESTYLLVKDQFEIKYRGEIEAKGKGKMKMYFVES
ncbi:MAG: AAA family ATPase [Flavobacteriales bacterium]|nr:AAA family ATPase [Flavobacteriales bacterium]